MNERIKLLKNLSVGNIIYKKGTELKPPFPNNIKINIEIDRGTLEYIKDDVIQHKTEVPVVEEPKEQLLPLKEEEKGIEEEEKSIDKKDENTNKETQKVPSTKKKTKIPLKRRGR